MPESIVQQAASNCMLALSASASWGERGTRQVGAVGKPERRRVDARLRGRVTRG